MNPKLSKYIPIWEKMRDTMLDSEHMKQKAYNQSSGKFQPDCGNLSMFSGFAQYMRPSEGMRRHRFGQQRYSDYLFYADWYGYPQETHDQGLGMIQNQPPQIDLPASLEYMKDDATSNMESLAKVMNITNSEQMVVSRIGLYLNAGGTSVEPFNIGIYKAETIQDWHLVMNDKGEKVADWVKLATDEIIDKKPVFLILYIEQDGIYSQYKTTNEDCKYEDLGLADDGFVDGSYNRPFVKEKTIDKIPFIVINVVRLGYDLEEPYLESLSDASIRLFQATALYSDNINWGGKSTLMLTGVDENNHYSTGNGTAIITNASEADGKYLTAGVEGTEPSLKHVERLTNICESLGFNLKNQGVESGIALATRIETSTASLKTLANTCAEGVEQLLKIGAEWVGDNPDDVNIEANTSFSDVAYTADDLVKMQLLVRSGSMSQEAFFNILKKQGLTVADILDDEELVKEIEEQQGTSL